jgi:4-hydroxy-tetrahydrodipicolinate synthase
MLKFKGIIPAVLTPFNNKGEFDEEAQRENLRFLIENGVHGLMVNGSTGEAENLSREERRKNVELAVEEAGGKIPVIAGTGVPSTKVTIDLSKDAKDAGADAVMIVTPFYLIPNEEGLIKHYKTIAEKVDIPIVLYNIPQHTKVNLDSILIEKLCNEVSTIVGLKDSYGNLSQFADTIARVGDKISVLTGCDDLILPSLILGAPGAIIALANIAPKMVVELFEYVQKGEINKAKEIYFKLLPIARAIGSEYNFPAPVKEAVNLLGRKAGPPRSPITQLSTKEKEEIKKALKHAGLIQ